MFDFLVEAIDFNDLFGTRQEVKCNHPGCYDHSFNHLAQVEYNQRHGMFDHANPQFDTTGSPNGTAPDFDSEI